ncbi:hypothetical protein D3C81_2239330 [compost metagenome]
MRPLIFHVLEQRSKVKQSLADRHNPDLSVIDREVLQVQDSNPVPQQLQRFPNHGILLPVIVPGH